MIENMLICLNNVAVFVLLVLPGVVTRKKKMISTAQLDGLSSLLMNILIPAMIIDVMCNVSINSELLHTALYTGIAASLVYLFSMGIAVIYFKLRKTDHLLQKVKVMCVAFNNTGFIGMPFIRLVLGDEALFIASICEMANDLILFTIGIIYLGQQKGKKEGFAWKNLFSPVLISVFVGLFLFLFDIALPDCLGQAISYFGNATTAIALFIVGLQLGEIQLKKLFSQTAVYEVIFWRMVLIPLICMIVLYVAFPQNVLANIVITLMFAMPTASTSSVLARQYRLDYKFATSCVMVGTVLLALTLPVWYGIINAVFS